MSTTTTNFGWTVPSDTDLVKDGAAAIRTALGGVDTSFVDLKGGTTGQVLAKASGTDLDFSWVAQDDSNAIQNAIVDAKGDLIAATAADTPARLAVGSDGQILTADSTAATGIKWAAPAAGGGITLITSTNMAGAASFTFSSIVGTYKDLVVIVKNYYQGSSAGLKHEFNSDTTSGNYEYTLTSGRATGGLTTYSNSNFLQDLSTQNSDGNNFMYLYIPDYTNTVAHKQIQNHGAFLSDNGNYVTQFGTHSWRNTSAITQIRIFSSNAGNFTTGTVQLYGVN